MAGFNTIHMQHHPTTHNPNTHNPQPNFAHLSAFTASLMGIFVLGLCAHTWLAHRPSSLCPPFENKISCGRGTCPVSTTPGVNMKKRSGNEWSHIWPNKKRARSIQTGKHRRQLEPSDWLSVCLYICILVRMPA